MHQSSLSSLGRSEKSGNPIGEVIPALVYEMAGVFSSQRIWIDIDMEGMRFDRRRRIRQLFAEPTEPCMMFLYGGRHHLSQSQPHSVAYLNAPSCRRSPRALPVSSALATNQSREHARNDRLLPTTDSVGVISLLIDVSKNLYAYYRAIRDCDAHRRQRSPYTTALASRNSKPFHESTRP